MLWRGGGRRWYGVRFANARHSDMLVNAYKDALVPEWQRPAGTVLATTSEDQDSTPVQDSTTSSLVGAHAVRNGTNDNVDAVLGKVCGTFVELFMGGLCR